MPPLPRARKGRILRTPATGFPSFYRDRRRPRLIAGDAWACLSYLLEEEYRLSRETRGQALAYLDQGRQFFETARQTLHRSRPLLYYYSFLNLAKTYLLARGSPLRPVTRHGLSDPRANFRVRPRIEGQSVVAGDPRVTGHSEIFPLFARALGSTARFPRSYRVLDLMGQVPGVHRIYTQLRRTDPIFCPIKAVELLSDGQEVWTRIRLVANDADVTKTLPKLRRTRDFPRLFRMVASELEGETWLESQGVPGRTRAIDRAIGILATRFRELGVWSLLTRAGYIHYLGAVAPSARVPQLCSVYAVMFYFGSIVRYKPYEFDRMAEGRYGWLLSEFLSSQPNQFLYLLTSDLAGVDVVRPWAE